MTRNAEVTGASIVVIGSFNPSIFTPDWLETHNLVGADDATAARQTNSLVISHEISSIETDWFLLQVTKDRFTVHSKHSVSFALVDLVVGALSLLTHTPVTALGINVIGHFKLATEADLHRIGDTLAPKVTWHSTFPEDKYSIGLLNLVLQIKQGAREGGAAIKDAIHVTVQPSPRVPNGVSFNYNDHRDIPLTPPSGMTTAEFAASMLEADWQSSHDNALELFSNILEDILGK